MAYTVLDVSTFNNITDYNSAVSGLSGVILRVGYRGYGSSGTLCKDGKFNQHYNAFVGKIPIGVYFLSQAVNDQSGLYSTPSGQCVFISSSSLLIGIPLILILPFL